MTMDTRNQGFKRASSALIGLVSLCALAVPLAPAKAQVYFGFGPGGVNVDVGVPAPYYYGPYYAPYYAPYYYRPHYRHW